MFASAVGTVANFFGLTKLKLAILAGLLITIIALSVTAWFLWGSNQKLNQEIGSLRLENVIAQKRIEQKNQDIADIKVANAEMAKIRAKNIEKIENLEIKLNALQLGATGITNAPVAQARANKLLDDRNRCLEIITGDKITTEELQLPPEQRNELCPELYFFKDALHE